MCMRASGASELRIFRYFYILKLLFLSIFCRYIRYFVGTNDTLVGLHVPTNFQMYRQNSDKTLFSTGPRGQTGVNPYRDCVDIVQKSCNVSAVAVQSPQPPHGNCTEPVRGSALARCPCGDCAMPPTTCLRATVLRFFQICKTSR